MTSVYMFSILSSVNVFFGTDMENLFKDQSFLRLVIISFVLMILMNDSGVLLSGEIRSLFGIYSQPYGPINCNFKIILYDLFAL